MSIEAVWTATADHSWEAGIYRTSQSHGDLVVTNKVDGLEILREQVVLSYPPDKGPDKYDIEMWKTMVSEAITHHYAQRGREG